MKETKRISKLLEAIYDGSPWIDVNLTETLENISAEQAAKKLSLKCNSIWEIVNHIISWRQNVLQRLQGAIIKTPGHNYFVPVKDISTTAWKKTLKDLKATQQQWTKFLGGFKEEDFEKVYPNNGLSYYEHIHGIIQHDAYHLGQISLLIKQQE